MARDSMTLDEVIQLTKQAIEKVNPDKRVYTEFRFAVWQVKQLLAWLEDYKQLKDDYADLDNRLRTANTEIDRLQSVSSWIPCSDRMPEDGQRVLICTGMRKMFVAEFDSTGNIFRQRIHQTCHTWYMEEVAHWMPLPEPPGGDDNA